MYQNYENPPQLFSSLKKKNPSSVEDFRPVALTCLVSKCLEKLILKLLLTQISDKLDPYQFAYKTKSSTFDALSTFTNTICQHLNQNSSHTARSLFIDFSSAYNTISSIILVHKLTNNFDSEYYVVVSLLLFSDSGI